MKQLSDDQLQQIQSLLAAGQKLESVKRYRGWMGCSLMQAKNAVEAIEKEGFDATVGGEMEYRSAEDSVLDEIDDLIDQGQKLNAVKLYKEVSGKSLMESKEFVEARMTNRQGSTRPTAVETQRSGCLSSLLLSILCTATIWGLSRWVS